MKYRLVILASALFLLSSCSTSTPPLDLGEIPPPPNAISRCPELDLIGETPDMGDLLRYTFYTIEKYNECALRHDALIDFLEREKAD